MGTKRGASKKGSGNHTSSQPSKPNEPLDLNPFTTVHAFSRGNVPQGSKLIDLDSVPFPLALQKKPAETLPEELDVLSRRGIKVLKSVWADVLFADNDKTEAKPSQAPE